MSGKKETEEKKKEESSSSLSTSSNAAPLQVLLKSCIEDFAPNPSLSRSRVNSLLEGLKADGDEFRQLEALSELADSLSICTEETLAGFPVDPFVQQLAQLLSLEHNPDIMLLACRSLTYLMEAIPSSCSSIVHHAVPPLLCAKLLNIEYMDVAEQSLQALEKLSVDHPTVVLKAGGLMAVLSFLDFFAIGVQRTAVLTAANICRHVPSDCFDTVADVVPNLASILETSQDPKIVENTCLSFVRLVDQFYASPEKIQVLANERLLMLLLRLVSVSNPGAPLSPVMYRQVFRTLALICRASDQLTLCLHQENISSIIHGILTSGDQKGSIVASSPNSPGAGLASSPSSNLIIRSFSTDLLNEILSLINQFLPRLPKVFSKLFVLEPQKNRTQRKATNSAAIETSIGFEIFEDKGTNTREQLFEEHPELLVDAAEQLFPSLLQTYIATLNIPVRHKCLLAITKFLYFSSPKTLETLLHDIAFASFVASLLSSKELTPVAVGLKITEILMEKLPVVYFKYLRREGVVFEIEKISKEGTGYLLSTTSPSRTSSSSATSETTSTNSLFSTSYTPSTPTKSGAHTLSTTYSPTSPSTPNTATVSLSSSSPVVPQSSSPAGSRTSTRSSTTTSVTSSSLQTDELRISIVKQASKILSDYLNLESESKKSTDELKELKSLVNRLAQKSEEATTDEENDKVILTEIGKMLTLKGISPFELAQSNLVPTLLQYLSPQSKEDQTISKRFRRDTLLCRRINFFCETMIAPRPSPLGALILKLHDSVNKSEHFPVQLHEVSSAVAGIKFLMQPFKIRLQKVAKCEDGVGEYAPGAVLIEPLATMNTLEDFLINRITVPEKWHRSSSFSSLPTYTKPSTDNLSKSTGDRRSHLSTKEKKVSKNSPDQKEGSKQEETEKKPRSKKREKREKAKKEALSSPTTTAESADQKEKEDKSGNRKQETKFTKAYFKKSLDKLFGHKSSRNAFNLLDEDKDVNEESKEGANPDDDSEKSVSGEVEEEGVDFEEGEEVEEGEGEGEGEGDVDGEREAEAEAEGEGEAEGGHDEHDDDYHEEDDDGDEEEDEGVRIAMGTASGRRLLQGAGEQTRAHHLVFLMDNRVLPYHTSVFQLIKNIQVSTDGYSDAQQPLPKLWEVVHTISYRAGTPEEIVTASASPSRPLSSYRRNRCIDETAFVSPLDKYLIDSPCKTITSGTEEGEREVEGEGVIPISQLLSLMRVLEGINSSLHYIFEGKKLIMPEGLNTGEFINQKLTAKILRQLQDPLALCGNALPDWCKQLIFTCPFLFGFDTRKFYFYATSFGVARALNTLHQTSEVARDTTSPEARIGRIQRQKVRVSREKILESAMKVMELEAKNRSILEIEYLGEVGTGLGPTYEFFTLVSRELMRKDLNLWWSEETHQSAESKWVFAPTGLFPRPIKMSERDLPESKKVYDLYRFMGTFLGKSLLDKRLLDIHLSKAALKILLDEELTVFDLITISPSVGKTIHGLWKISMEKRKIDADPTFSDDQKKSKKAGLLFDGSRLEDLCLSFVMPGDDQWELKDQGKDEIVTIDNVEEYVSAVLGEFFGPGTDRQLLALREGFDRVFPMETLGIFKVDELESLISGWSGEEEGWDTSSLYDSIQFDHGYSSGSNASQIFLQVLSELTQEERRQFLLFVTGSPRLPVGGFKSLHPRLTIVRKDHVAPLTADDYLPSVMTCANYVKLPDYSSKEVMKKKLLFAVQEGLYSFHLS